MVQQYSRQICLGAIFMAFKMLLVSAMTSVTRFSCSSAATSTLAGVEDWPFGDADEAFFACLAPELLTHERCKRRKHL